MAVTLPSINITFTQKAASLIERSERGIATLILRGEAKTGYKSYASFNEISESDYTAANYQYITDLYALGCPYRVNIVSLASAGKISDALALIEANVTTGWVTVAGSGVTDADFTALMSWIGTCEQNAKTYKAIVVSSTSPDKRHIVNFANAKVTFVDSRGEVDGKEYLPSLLGMFAAANVVEGCTYADCSNLVSAAAVDKPNEAVNAGKLVLMNDVDGVYVGVAVNSLTTTNGRTLTEDMKYIETVEAMDLIADDIRDEFRHNYVGKYANSYDNQILFISAVRGYFDSLSRQAILDPEYDNTVDVDIAAQRQAWLASGKTEAAEWSDSEVKRMTFKRTVYLTADIKLLGSMEHLTFEISMV